MRRLLNPKLLLIQVSLLVALACAQGGQPDRSSTGPVLEAAPATPTAAAAPLPTPAPEPAALPMAPSVPNLRRGGALTISSPASFPSRDVHQESQAALASLGPGLAYSRLLRIHSGPADSPSAPILECDLCESWRMTADFVYEFKLRSGVHWQKVAPVNGRPLVAQDLVFSYNRQRTPGWPNASILAPIRKVAAPDTRTLQVRLAYADSDGLLALADGHSKVIAPEVVALHGDLQASPVAGTGPWMWDASSTADHTILTRNPDYFLPSQPLLDRLEFRSFSTELGTQWPGDRLLAAFRAGQVDVFTPDLETWRQIRQARQSVNTVVSAQGGHGLTLSINVQSPNLQSAAVRHAVFKAIDPWDYLDALWLGQGQAGVGLPVLDSAAALGKDYLRSRYFADPAAARQLLASAGMPLPAKVDVVVGDFGPSYVAAGNKLADDLAAVGFKPTMRRLNAAQFQEQVFGNQRDYQIALGVTPPADSTNAYLATLLHSQGRWNVAGHQDKKLDNLIQRQAAELDPALRQQQLRELQQYVVEQGYLFNLVNGGTRWVYADGLRAFYPVTANSEYGFWSQVWREK
ncbi:MAG: ABC transporter substrate-binding protein [SAR202 cluster bacterium]|nr:ABC transporter substrate-binding protein [SAR202 cluster bacterium]